VRARQHVHRHAFEVREKAAPHPDPLPASGARSAPCSHHSARLPDTTHRPCCLTARGRRSSGVSPSSTLVRA
jgi:hypothetical protein